MVKLQTSLNIVLINILIRLEHFGSHDLTTEADLINSPLNDQLLHSSDYPIEIPARVSNPIVHDRRFRESDDKDMTLDLNLNKDAELSSSLGASLSYIQTLVQN